MSEEHGYQRSGKKCREKFENLYKYYKKTKEGKAGRHDGKHYRFFRQLEALYGDNSNQTTSSTVRTFQGPSQTNQDNMFYSHHNNLKHYSDSLSLTNSTDFDTSSSDHSNEAGNIESVEIKRRKRKSGRSWKVKIKDFIDSQVKKLVEKQEEWLDKLVKTMEEKEKERMLRDEEWRKQEAIRIEREHKFWAKERAWIEARDAALMETLHNIAGGREMKAGEGLNVITAEFQNNIQNEEDENENEIRGADSWQESEVARLQQLRNEMETWEEVATKMACFGYQRTAFMCKKKWESISKKHKENSSRSCFYFNNNDQASMYNQGSSGYCDVGDQRHEIGKLQRNDGSSPSNSNVAPGDTCFPFLMSEGGNLWENFGLKINKSNQNH